MPRLLLVALACAVSLAQVLTAAEKILHEKTSMFGTVIVSEDGAFRTLRFEKGGARQSVVKMGDPAHLELPYASVALTSLALCRPAPARALVVGHGAGTLPMFLHHHHPEAVIDSVDIDPEVVRVSREFFGFRDDARMRAHVADGRAFIEKTRDPYDLIFLDAFGSDSVPPSLTTREFLQAVRRAIRPDGVVVGNIWHRHLNRLYDSMLQTYLDVFDEVCVIEVNGTGNMILLALPRREALTRESLAERAGRLSAERGFRFDLVSRVRSGFRTAPAEVTGGHVLRDADLGVTK